MSDKKPAREPIHEDARIDALEADSADRLERLRAVRADSSWKSVLAS